MPNDHSKLKEDMILSSYEVTLILVRNGLREQEYCRPLSGFSSDALRCKTNETHLLEIALRYLI